MDFKVEYDTESDEAEVTGQNVLRWETFKREDAFTIRVWLKRSKA